MITYRELGLKGRLGNQLFQIASTLGIAHANRTEAGFPDWLYAPFFKKPLPSMGTTSLPDSPEPHYHYAPMISDNVNLRGWLQSERYWAACESLVREQFEFRDELVQVVRSKSGIDAKRRPLAISIRRGDFVNNKNYAQLPIRYYILALLDYFPDWAERQIVIFSDDIEYCRVHFECLPDVVFAERMTSIEQLCLMSLCDDFIISNSTFSWWGAYLGAHPQKRVVRPPKALAGPLAQTHDERDYWPAEWLVSEYEGRRIDLRDFTFTIPVYHDHEDRMKNTRLAVAMLQQDFDTTIVVGEQGGSAFRAMPNYRQFDYEHFHRTRMLNEMAADATTPYVVNYDCDVLLPPMQLVLMQRALRLGAHMVYPYDGRFARMPRQDWYTPLAQYRDIGIVGGTVFKGKNDKPMPVSSVGGVVAVQRKAFFESGGENEEMISFCPEDCERWDRWHALGYRVERISGTVYHMDHFIGVNSSSRNPFFRKGHALLDEIRAMSPEALREYVDTWPWKKVYLQRVGLA